MVEKKMFVSLFVIGGLLFFGDLAMAGPNFSDDEKKVIEIALGEEWENLKSFDGEVGVIKKKKKSEDEAGKERLKQEEESESGIKTQSVVVSEPPEGLVDKELRARQEELRNQREIMRKKERRRKSSEERERMKREKLEEKMKKKAMKEFIQQEKKETLGVERRSIQKRRFTKFYVYSDAGDSGNHYVPTGWMGDISDIKFSMKCFRKVKKGKSCIKIDYSANRTEGAGWAGIYWQHPPNNWGTQMKGFDLTGARELTFYARGDRGGEIIEAFKVGGISGNHPDSSASSIGPIMLKKKWQKYTIPLEDKDLFHIIGGFMFVLSDMFSFFSTSRYRTYIIICSVII